MAYVEKRKDGRGRPKGNGPRHIRPKTEIVVADAAIEEIAENVDNIREAIRAALVDNLPNLGPWLKAVGKDDPKGALTAFKDYSEFVLAKYQRSDQKSDAAPVNVVFETIGEHKKRTKKTTENDDQ
jgi:hypothetical protein